MRWLMMVWMMVMLWAVPAANAQVMTATESGLELTEGPPQVPDGWQAIETPWLTMYGPDNEIQVLMHLGRKGSAAVPRLAEQLGVPIGGTIHVVVAPTRREFMALQGNGVPEYADGTAWPSRGHIYLQRPRIRTSERPLEQVLEHEIVHILLGRAFAPGRPPAWLQEGTATVLSGEYNGEMSRQLVAAIAAGHQPDLDAISHTFPRTQPAASLAYAESADFIVFMRETYGDDAIAQLVDEAAQGAPLGAAVRAVTGEFLEDVEPRWRRQFRSGWGSYVTLLSSWEMYWAVGGLVAMVGLVLARRRGRKRLREMAEEEARLDALVANLWSSQDQVH